ncbi:MAG TPA: hypothetical protein VKQ08_07365, partial [Cyclobacteriaceae bacterium]|nr:hypothetical protein [Cyclobacteriaceae bacterium]
MKFAITLFSAFMFFLVTKGQPAARAEKNKSDHSFNLAIQIISDHPLKDSLTIIFSRNETFTGAFYDGAYCVTPLNGTIPFEMHVKEVHYIGRLTLYSREINNSYLPVNQMVEPGDNIKIEIRVKEDGTSTIEFSGHGSSKYSLGKMAEGVSLAKKDLRLQAALRKK